MGQRNVWWDPNAQTSPSRLPVEMGFSGNDASITLFTFSSVKRTVFLLFTARYSLLAIMVKWACRLQRAKKATRQYNGSWLLVNAKLALGDILLTHLHWFSFKHLFKIDGIKPKTFHSIDKNKPKQKRTRVPIAHHKQSTSKWNCLSLVHEIPTSRYSSVNWAKNVLSMRSTACH